MKVPKKDPYDKTSTARSTRLASDIKAAGGSVFSVRFKTAVELSQLDRLVAVGYGASKNDVILKLVAEKAKEIL